MFVPGSFAEALIMMVASTCCSGSWANTYKLTRGYRFELYYWDYVAGIVVTSLILALTLGRMRPRRRRHFAGTPLARLFITGNPETDRP